MYKDLEQRISDYFSTRPRLATALAVLMPILIYVSYRGMKQYASSPVAGVVSDVVFFVLVFMAALLYPALLGQYIGTRLLKSFKDFSAKPIVHTIMIGFAVFSIFYYDAMALVRDFIVSHPYFCIVAVVAYLCIFAGLMYQRRTGINTFEVWMKNTRPAIKIPLVLSAVVVGFLYIFVEVLIIVADIIGLVQTVSAIVKLFF